VTKASGVNHRPLNSQKGYGLKRKLQVWLPITTLAVAAVMECLLELV